MLITKDVSAAAALTDTECRAFWNCCLIVPKGGLVVEVGCQYGRSSSLIGQGRRLAGYRSIHIDPYSVAVDGHMEDQPDVLVSWSRMMLSCSGVFTLLCMKTEQAEWHLQRLCCDGIDLAFIDGDHDGPAVTIDMYAVGSRVKRGGRMMCHDYTHPHFQGLRDAIDAFTLIGWEKEGQFDSLGIWRRIHAGPECGQWPTTVSLH